MSKPLPWVCGRCGACCRRPSHVLLTVSEADALTVSSPVRASFLPSDHAGFVRLVTGPCPYLAADTHGNLSCSVYAVRPYNCRRYLCGRSSCDEPWDDASVPARVFENRQLRRQYARNQNTAQVWANAHGWQPQ